MQATALEARITRNLPSLSPKLQQVAHYCLQHARHLHLRRIQEVAQHCETQPVTVVRLAKRYGFRGFLDFKMAFLTEAGADQGQGLQVDGDTVNAFGLAAHLLVQARSVWLQASPATAQVAQCYADMLRVAGLQVQWQPPFPWQPEPGDVLLWVALATESAAAPHGIPVVRISDAPNASPLHHAHLCTPLLGQGLQGIPAGLTLAQAVHSARQSLLIQ
ncbi:hypothetical protein os1_12800 [Comamonadaceae bacterium OS-1]|nr:hypothetical protein os1_12800 [Comamonadaceae bacterium OS-1]